MLLRTVRCVNGEVQVNLDCEPSFDYGRSTARWEYDGKAYHSALAHGDGMKAPLRLTSDMNLGFEGPRATGRTLIKDGETLFAALSWSEHAAPQTSEEASERLVWTAHHWPHWLDRGQFPDHPWRSHLQRSALTLKGLSYAPTGALVAAATTSLPESPAGSATGTTATPGSATPPSCSGALHARLRLGGERLLLLPGRRRRGRPRRPPDHVWHRG